MEDNDADIEDSDLEKEEEKIIVSSTVPENIIDLKHSFGYDCKRLFNLCLIDEDTLVFASGNLLHYYSISRNELTLRRTIFGGGVGFITKNENPDFNHLTIAENGKTPIVFIYEYPDHKVVAELKGGAVSNFTCGTYNNNGELLATQAGNPDYMLTIWNWQSSSIVLRSKAYQNDVLDVAFSQFNPILLATCGLSHVQFWKMAETFTGLKLKSDLGRFGKTDTCDVYAVYMLADEKVISGCEWGNMLLWEAGLIKVEVTRKARIPCHTKPITRIIWMGNNEVMTIGMDGYARIWFWETVELADPPEDDRFVEIDPIYEFRIGDRDESCESRHLLKAKPYDEGDCQYYSQDGNGGVWLCDLNTETAPNSPKKLFSCHGGKISAGQASPVSRHLATLGADGKLNIYNYETETLLLQEPFNTPGRDLIWLETTVDPSGMVMILGFEDGVVRQVILEINSYEESMARIHFIDAVKPHAAPITFLGVSPSKDTLVSGALDKTLFLFHIKLGESNYIEMIPLGFVLLSGSPTCLHWLESKPRKALIGCQTGEVYECDLPPPESIDLVKVRPTWRIEPLSTNFLKHKSVKSRIRRDIETAAAIRKKRKKLAAKKKEMKRLMEINPGLQIDEGALADSSEEEEDVKEKPLYIPDPPSPVIWLQYTSEGTIWLSMGGYDAGYIYEVQFGEDEPLSSTLIPDADDIEIHSYMYIDDYLIFGMQNGQIRINAVKSDFRDLSDFWVISMHDNLNGVIPRVFTSHDGKWFFSIGYDGNVFFYEWKGTIVSRECPPPSPSPVSLQRRKDIEDKDQLSLEEVKVQENLEKLHAFEEEERRRLYPSFEVMQLQVNWVTEKIKTVYQEKLNAVLKKMKHDVTGACYDAQDLYDLMFEPLEYIPFEVFGIRDEVVVRVFRLPKLVAEAELMNEEQENEDLDTQRSKSNTIVTESKSTFAGSQTTLTSSASTVYDFTEKVLLKFYIRALEFFSFLRQIKREELEQVIEMYGDELDDEEEQPWHDVEEHDEEEEEVIDGEGENISLVEKAIRFLKNSIRDTIEVKNVELTIIHEILYALKSDYNNKVLSLKVQKFDIYKKCEKLKLELLGADENVVLPPLRGISTYNEYPEDIFKEPFIPLRSFESILWEKPFNEAQIKQTAETRVEKDDTITIPSQSLENLENQEEEFILEGDSREECTVGFENRVENISTEINYLDEELTKVLANRLQYEGEIKYLEYLLEISNEELKILQDSELKEKLLVEEDEFAKTQRNEIIESVKRLKTEIEVMNKNVIVMKDDIKRIQAEFNDAIKGNKFFKFLKRIFEKKFKPKKEKKSDDESGSSTDDSSTDDSDDDSGGSGNMTTIRLDESHCPTGCDKKLYDLAFDLRNERHLLEQKIYDGIKLNEIKKFEIGQLNFKIPTADELCVEKRTNLLIFRRQKVEQFQAVEKRVIDEIDGFGLKIRELEVDSEQFDKYLGDLLKTKKVELCLLNEELHRPTAIYTEKLRKLLEILEEQERLRQKKPSVVETVPSEHLSSLGVLVKPPTPPPPFDFEAFAAEKVMKLVQRFFVRYLSKHISESYMRKYIPKVSRCLGNIGRNFTCELADNIIEVIVENLQRIIPKKYLIHVSLDDIRGLFKDVVAVFELDPVEINSKVVITECTEKCLKSFSKMKCANKTQRIVLEISKAISEELPMDDVRSPETYKLLAKLLAREAVIIPNCLNVETLVDQIVVYAKENMLNAVTSKIVRAYADELLKELLIRKAEEVRVVKPKDKICRDMRRKKELSRKS